MLRSILTHLLLPCSPAVLATALGWPAFDMPERAALLALVAASFVTGWWQLVRADRRSRALSTLTMQVEELVNSEDPMDPQFVADLTEPLDDELQALAEQLETYVATVADAADSQDDAAHEAEALRFEVYEQETARSCQPAALEEMTAIVNEAAQRANDAAEFARKAKTAADKGATSMQRMVEAMGEVEASSTATARMISVIDDIAFETNLMAVNAAVEAARAGDAGRGFAVVADEVRNLAQRGAEAAASTSQLIAATSQHARQGSQIAQDVDGMLREVADTTARLAKLVAQIATRTQQSGGDTGQNVDDPHAGNQRHGGAPVSFGNAFDEAFS